MTEKLILLSKKHRQIPAMREAVKKIPFQEVLVWEAIRF